MNPPYDVSGPLLDAYANLRRAIRQPAFLVRRTMWPTPVDAPVFKGLVFAVGLSLVLWALVILGVRLLT